MISFSLAIQLAACNTDEATLPLPTGTAAEALPDNPGRIMATLSPDYRLPEGHDVRFQASTPTRSAYDPSQAVSIAPGKAHLTDAAFTGLVHPAFFLVAEASGEVVREARLPAIAIASPAGEAPVLKNATAAATGPFAVSGRVTAEIAGGTLHWIAARNGGAPIASAIVEGRDATGAAAAASGTQAVTRKGLQNVEAAGLEAGTGYGLHFVQIGAEGAVSEPVSAAPVTTPARLLAAAPATLELVADVDKAGYDLAPYFTGGAAPMTYAIVSSDRPGDVSLSGPRLTVTGEGYEARLKVGARDGAGQQAELDLTLRVGRIDDTAPILAGASASARGATALRGVVTTDDGEGLVHWVATRSTVAPEAALVKAGKDHTGATAPGGSGAVAPGTAGPVEILVSALITGETYYLHFAQEDAAGNISRVASTAGVTPVATLIRDVTNPAVTAITAGTPLRAAWQGVTADDYAVNNDAAIRNVAVSFEVNGSGASADSPAAEGDTLRVAVDVEASDGAKARFIYGPVTIIAAPVVDNVAPVLANFAMTAGAPDKANGSVTTNEAGGTLRWFGQASGAALANAQIQAKFTGIGGTTPAPAGTVPVTEAGVIPLAATGLAPETGYDFYCCHEDAAGNRSNVVKTAARTPAAGNLEITVEDFSRDMVPFHSGLAEGWVAPEAPEEPETEAPETEIETPASDTKAAILALATDPGIGSQHKGAYKLPGRDSLPAGVSVSGNKITITSGFSGWLEGWDFTGHQLIWNGGEVRLRNSILGERDGAKGLLAYLDVYANAKIVEVVNNDVLGPNAYGGAGVAFKYRTSGNGTSTKGPGLAPGRVAGNRFSGLSSDAIKPTGGIVENNVILYDRNLDRVAFDWSSSATYAQGDLARNAKGNVFRSKSGGNRGNQVPSNKSGTTFWENLDPHCDAINPAIVTDPLTIRGNYVDMDPDPDRSVGMNNAVRSVPNTNTTTPHKRVDVTGNVFIGSVPGLSKLIQATDNGNPNHVPDRFWGNWLKSRSQGDILHTQQAAGTVWEDNRDLDTGRVIPGVTGMVGDASLAVAPKAGTGAASTRAVASTISGPAPAVSPRPAARPTPILVHLAEVPRGGTATPGMAIEARAVPVGGATPTPWTQIATADGSGRWSGTLDVPRSRDAYRFEVRLAGAPYVSARTSRSFVSGILIAVHTQSDIASPAMKTRTPWVTIDPEPLIADDMVQMFYLDGFDIDAPEQPASNLRRLFLSDATPYSPGMAAIANTFMDLIPDTHVALVMHTVSGTSPTEMASDNNAGRNWNNDRKLHDFVTRDGNRPGLHASYFSSSYTGIADKFGEALAPIFTGRRRDGSIFRAPGTHGFGHSQTLRIDHTYTDLYDLGFTKTMVLPISKMEDSFRKDFLNNPVFDGLFVEGRFDIYNAAVSGRYNASQNRMDDTNHANSHKEWGGPRRVRMWALNMIEALGEHPELEQPMLDIVETAPNGDNRMVRIGSTSGPISTLRKQLGLAELNPAKYPAYGDVFGVFVNGAYVKAYIGDDAGKPAKQGWIYVRKPSGSFVDNDIIGTLSTGFARPKDNKPSGGAPSGVDYYLDDAVLSKPVVPSAIHNVWGLHAIMPQEAGDAFRYRDAAAGRWAGTVGDVPDIGGGGSDNTGGETGGGGTGTGGTGTGGGTGETGGGGTGGARYEADFSTDLSASPLLSASADTIVRHEPGASMAFVQNGARSGALVLTGSKFAEVNFAFTPDIRLQAGQAFEIDLAAYAASLPNQNSDMAIRLSCTHAGGTDMLAEIFPMGGTNVGNVLADVKGGRFTCKGANGQPVVEFVIGNPRNDKRRIALMKLAIRAL